jgi:hypothetical protein
MPEVFLKALTIARNLHDGKPVGFTSVDLDMQRHYRPRMNVVQRPTLQGGKGYEITGHHEIMGPNYQLVGARRVERGAFRALARRFAPGLCSRGGGAGRRLSGTAFGGASCRMGVAFPESARSARPESKGERSEPGARKGGRSTPPAPTSCQFPFHFCRSRRAVSGLKIRMIR